LALNPFDLDSSSEAMRCVIAAAFMLIRSAFKIFACNPVRELVNLGTLCKSTV
jgi:hypothetical protein